MENNEEIVSLDLEKIRDNLSQYSSQKLCEIVVCDRYFGFNPELGLMCMQELAARRLGGDEFLFEQYIDEQFSKLPVLNFSAPDLRTTLQNIIKMGKR